MKLIIFVTLLAIFSAGFAGAIVTGNYFDRIFVIWFENQDYSSVVNNTYLTSLYNSNEGELLTNYFAVSHPSEPNYVASIYGSTAGITNDGDYNITGCNVVDLLEAKSISWKGYFENYTCGVCYTGDSCPTKKVDSSVLDTDISGNTVPQFAYYVPNLNDDGHDTSLTYAMNWFQTWFNARRTNPNFNTNTLFVVIWDEAVSSTSNQVFAMLYGTPVVPTSNHDDNTAYTHYSIMKTVEANWNLTNCNRNDVTANQFMNLRHP
ncbi:4493_t:CDS:2 [Cetraspora pellucida]|uniref:4493_t:CDS:1 n=1 Tax=Cetraspora pellucida TaxID=1433469 RepID=A0A9N9ADI0_9GLOM|nr:4493_t:CDS:2 [Cetraspora pellucida]